MSQEELKKLRDEIAKITMEIICLSNKRLSLARRIGEIKARNNMMIEDPAIESELRAKVVDLGKKYPIDLNFSLKILDLLIEESKRVQREIFESKS